MTFQDLPWELQLEIFGHAGVATLCRFYIHCPMSKFKLDLGRYLKTCVIEVTPEEVVDDDINKIDFYTYGMLPKCRIHVTTTVGLWKMAMWHLQQVQYRQVSLTVDNPSSVFTQINVRDLDWLVDSLSINGNIEFSPAHLPGSLTRLSLKNCKLKSHQGFRRLTNLTHFKIQGCLLTGSFTLPQSLISLDIIDNLNPNFSVNVSRLRNLRHVTGRGITNIPWPQIETASFARPPDSRNLTMLREVTVRNGCTSFRNHQCPHLENVTFLGRGEEGDITEFFTDSQLAQLKSLKGYGFRIDDVDLLERLEVLHMEVDEPLDEHFPLPQNLVELKAWSTQPVESIPSQLQVFEVEAPDNDSRCRVEVSSTNLKTLVIKGATTVAIDCPYLTNLKLARIQTLSQRKTPRLVTLDADGVRFPLVNVPWLSHLTLKRTTQDVVISNHLKTVTLEDVGLLLVNFTADMVTIRRCTVDDDTDEPFRIEAKTLHVDASFDDFSGMTCQELICVNGHKTGFVPDTVERLSLSNVAINDQLARSLARCDRLKALHIMPARPPPPRVPWGRRFPPRADNWPRFYFVVDVLNQDHEEDLWALRGRISTFHLNLDRLPIIVPILASVRQLSLGYGPWDVKMELRFENPRQVEHVEYLGSAQPRESSRFRPPSQFHSSSWTSWTFSNPNRSSLPLSWTFFNPNGLRQHGRQRQ